MNNTKSRIKSIWRRNGHSMYGSNGQAVQTAGASMGDSMYSGASITPISEDFLGDWRAEDSFMRFNLWRVRARSRQLERGNPWCIAFKRNMLNNVLGSKGFHLNCDVKTSEVYGDSVNDQKDSVANTIIETVMDEFGQSTNMTSRKKLNRREVDRLILSRLIFDGEVFIRKLKGFDNDFGFTWQVINADYCDFNLTRVEANGNITKMGVEQDMKYGFPIAYWFFNRRPNDYYYNWAHIATSPYVRVPADEVIHIYLQTEDDEQTRGWPWPFAAMLVLFRMGKYQEAALINAAIGASRGVYFEKQYPEGFTGDPKELEDDSTITLDLPQGSALELPYGVSAKLADMKYPDQDFAAFNNALLLTTSAVFGTSYATSTGDLSQANFVSSRLGQLEEREQYKHIQQFMIDNWKQPGFSEELYRAIISGKANLPISRFNKFNKSKHVGRRWPFVQPVDDMRAKELAINNCTTSVGIVIEETTQESAEDMFKRIADDNKLMEKYGLERILTGKIGTEASIDAAVSAAPVEPPKPASTKK
jgi:lambda family phage portal protein